MVIDRTSVKKWQRVAVAGLMGFVLCSVVGACAGDQPKPTPQPTVDQVRGHADRTFEKLKQEEQERAAQPSAPR
jgi:hypothetical protein